MADEIQKAIQLLEKEYKAKKEAFDKWREENAALSEHEQFIVYVDQFRTWERTVLENLNKLKAALESRKLIAKPAELPTVDLDTQLENALREVTLPEFVLAFMSMAHKDPSFLKKAFEVVIEESRSTGFSNPILPQKSAISSRSTPSFGGYHQPSPLASNSVPLTIPSNSSGIYLPPTQQPTRQLVVLSSARYGIGTPPTTSGYSNNTTQQQQMNSYGLLPEGWRVDPAIRKQPKPSSPSAIKKKRGNRDEI
ncbi:hypothetical protein Mgra_00002996 [Meloidogyne graminicola]|uniref:Uncharacterized protein n=1 Tax=Meloidogyne graminicola TaxID=189291 RepID=A0A8S9ZWH2_9BILA|nr:hypothetical protein Mgra_00002996 [Meloidogyne graminicola]